jgi:hypothetical protein
MLRDETPVISPKDLKQPLFKEISTNFIFRS